MLADVSGSMEPYARAYLQLLHCAAGGAHAETFVFATRLTRLTRQLRIRNPNVALQRAAASAPDWAGGTRLGDALKAFNDGWGRRGLARGAVVLIVSDGWDSGDPASGRRADGQAVAARPPCRLGEPPQAEPELSAAWSARCPPRCHTSTHSSAATRWTRCTTFSGQSVSRSPDAASAAASSPPPRKEADEVGGKRASYAWELLSWGRSAGGSIRNSEPGRRSAKGTFGPIYS